MAGAAVTRPGTAKRRWKPPRPPRKPRYKRPGTRCESAALDESALLGRLQHHALGLADMTTTQVRAAEIVLKKAKAADEPKNHAVRNTISAEPLSEEEWQRRYAG
jgi:hypothetical protein